MDVAIKYIFFPVLGYFAWIWFKRGRECVFHPDLTAKNVVITGGTKGIGLEVAKEFVRMNANVYITARSSSKNALDELKKLRTNGSTIQFLPMDSSDFSSIENFTSFLDSKNVRVDILVTIV